jgi:hypothetical protein
MTMPSAVLRGAIDWLEKGVGSIRYGSLAISVTIHDGQVRRIERTVVESVKQDNQDELPEL